jgi:hypothetical protein
MEAIELAYCIYTDTLAKGSVPLVRDENDRPVVFPTRLEAEREIADGLMTRLQEFLDGQREFEDAIRLDEYIVEVSVMADGSIVDEDDNLFAARRSH